MNTATGHSTTQIALHLIIAALIARRLISLSMRE